MRGDSKAAYLSLLFQTRQRFKGGGIFHDIQVVVAAVQEHTIEKIRVQSPQAALNAHARMLSRKNICGLAIPKFLAGFGNEKELVAASAHQAPKAFFRAPVSRRGVEQVDAAFERKVEQKFDVV